MTKGLVLAGGGAKELSDFAPRMISFKINPEKIRDVIGKGGSVIRALTEETGTTINVEDDGMVTISSPDMARVAEARRRIEEITAEVEAGQIYEGTVTRLLDFGAIVQLLPGKDGLLHISQIANRRIGKPDEVLSVGDVVDVKITAIDNDKQKISLSIRALSEPEPAPRRFAPEAPAVPQEDALVYEVSETGEASGNIPEDAGEVEE